MRSGNSGLTRTAWRNGNHGLEPVGESPTSRVTVQANARFQTKTSLMAEVIVFASGTAGLWADVAECNQTKDIRSAVLTDRIELMRLSRGEYAWPPRVIKYRMIGN